MGEYRPIELIRLVDTLARIDRSLAAAHDQEGELAKAIDGHGEVERALCGHAADLLALQPDTVFSLRMVLEMLHTVHGYVRSLAQRMGAEYFIADLECLDVIVNMSPKTVLLAEDSFPLLQVEPFVSDAKETLEWVTLYRNGDGPGIRGWLHLGLLDILSRQRPKSTGRYSFTIVDARAHIGHCLNSSHTYGVSSYVPVAIESG